MTSTENNTEATNEIGAALATAQQEFGVIARTRKGQVGPRVYLYADLADVVAAVRPALNKHGIGYTQSVVMVDGSLMLLTTLWHKSGQQLRSAVPLVMAPDRGGPQGMGSALTYARRYGLSCATGTVSEEDDDGAAAQPVAGKTKAAPAPLLTVRKGEKPVNASQADWQKKPATEKQIGMLKTLWQIVEPMEQLGDWKAFLKSKFGKTLAKELTGGEASQLIEHLKSLQAKHAASTGSY
jgi:hypothetical protein